MWKHPTAKPTVLAIAIAGALGVTGAQAAQPYQKPDDSFVSISGTVTSPTADDPVLDYGMMDYEFMDGRVIKADAVTTLVDEQQS
ncbi:hypothetical protein [Pseudohaliea sp.]|uniref:hypothetical protein n=1 Tax=Pseudohaliea sp. TaxID=2740289 RepID=UPI0032F020D9